MGEAIGEMLPIAVVVALTPTAIIAIVLMLVTPRGRANGPAFLVGWFFAVLVVGAIALALASPADPSSDGGPATWVSVLKLVLGLLLLVVCLRQWQGRDGADEGSPPKWMTGLDGFTPVKSLGAGAALAGVNPKNLILLLAGVAAVAQTGISAGQESVVWLIFTLIASIGVATPVGIYFALGDRASALLDSIKTWMIRHNGAIMAAICLIFGVKLIGDAISGLSS
jgi:threonine/homoserine/homoserine lactone efflux protein